MNDQEALDAVRGLVAGILHLPADSIDPESDLRAMGLNSVDLIDIVATLEARWGAQFDPTALQVLTCATLSAPLRVAPGQADQGVRA